MINYLQVLSKTVEDGEISTVEDFKVACEKLSHTRMKFCPGFSSEEYAQYKQVIGYDVKRVRITDHPVRRIASKDCLLWYLMPLYGSSKEKQQSSAVLCKKCVSLRGNLQAGVRRLSNVTPEMKVKREQANSSFPMKYLSPESLQRRKMNIKMAQKKEKRRIKKYLPKTTLAEKQRNEMCLLNSTIEEVVPCIPADGECYSDEIESSHQITLEKDEQKCNYEAQECLHEDQ